MHVHRDRQADLRHDEPHSLPPIDGDIVGCGLMSASAATSKRSRSMAGEGSDGELVNERQLQQHRCDADESESEAEAEADDLEEPLWVGPTDDDGAPHGEGALWYAGCVDSEEPSGSAQPVLVGGFVHGAAEGACVMWLGEDGDCMRGCWSEGVLQGPGEYVYGEDGERVCGSFVEGVLHGAVKRLTRDGVCVWTGTYDAGVPHGPGTQCFVDGGRLEAQWEAGAVTGPAVYTYPDGVSQLRGEWSHGDLVRGTFHTSVPPAPSQQAQASRVAWDASTRVLANEASDPDEETGQQGDIGPHPTQPCPYEALYVYVKPSPIQGEGLFAARDLPPNVLVSWYNGVKVAHSVVDARSWGDNRNTISLDADIVIDVPPQLNVLSVYHASLGHKANHQSVVTDGRAPNAEYCLAFAPQFGHIKGIRTIATVAMDEEIVVDYGYTDEKPQWYVEAERQQSRGSSMKDTSQS